MEFRYAHGIPTVEQAMSQALAHADEEGVGQAALTEIRNIMTAEISTLFDLEGAAIDWNEAIERAMRCVEGTL